jgi:DNA-binding NtrC family response regulator
MAYLTVVERMAKLLATTNKMVERVQFTTSKERTPTILIVDDEALIRMTVSDFLQECGFKVLEASNAAEAIEVIQSCRITIDLVFSDVRMPGELDGFGLSTWIKKNRPELPVILTSGDAKTSDTALAICSEVHFLPKPFDLQLALAHIRQEIERRKKEP